MELMLKSALIFIGLNGFLWASNIPLNPPVVAKVNGEPIFERDLTLENNSELRSEKIKKAIHYRLLIQEAKKRGLERSPDIQSEINKLLYKKLLESEQLKQKSNLNPTEKDLRFFYDQFPLIRIHHLVLNRRTETEKQVASLALEQIQKEIKKGTPFEQLCTQFSQESSGLFGGDTDFRGPHNFPEEIYIKIRSLPKNTISEPIEVGTTIHLFDWFDKKPFTSAPASYLQYLQSKIEEDRQKTLLLALVKDLETQAKIETPYPTGKGE